MDAEAAKYLAELREFDRSRIEEFLAGTPSRREAYTLLNNLVELETHYQKAVIEDYILGKRLGPGEHMRSILNGLVKSLIGKAKTGGFYREEKTNAECIEVIRQQSNNAVQFSLEYIDRWESYAAMFNALPVFRPQAA